MKKRAILVIYLMLTTLFLFFTIESVSYILLKSRGENVGFLYNSPTSNVVSNVAGMGYDEIDPLCGWGMSDEAIKKLGYVVDENCVVLEKSGHPQARPIKIFITGGSTTDLTINPRNWPSALRTLLIEHSINAKLYVAAQGGYSTAQELFTLLRSGLPLKPDIHISYSGVNEGYDDFGYVSDYEQSFFEHALKQKISSLLPSTVYLIRTAVNRKHTSLKLRKNKSMSPFSVWTQNMKIMKGIANEYNYAFVGILQPVAGISNKEDTTTANYKNYSTYYPQAKSYIAQNDSSLYDFTPIFDTCKGKVFIDDCHITTPYQKVVARQIFELLWSEGWLK